MRYLKHILRMQACSKFIGNQLLGPGVFDALDRHAARLLRVAFPGC